MSKEIFDIKNTHNILSSEIVAESGTTPYLCASAENNGVSSYISYKNELLEKGNCIFIGGKTFVGQPGSRAVCRNSAEQLFF